MCMAAYRRGGGVVPMRMYAVADPCGQLSSEPTVGQIPIGFYKLTRCCAIFRPPSLHFNWMTHGQCFYTQLMFWKESSSFEIEKHSIDFFPQK